MKERRLRHYSLNQLSQGVRIPSGQARNRVASAVRKNGCAHPLDLLAQGGERRISLQSGGPVGTACRNGDEDILRTQVLRSSCAHLIEIDLELVRTGLQRGAVVLDCLVVECGQGGSDRHDRSETVPHGTRT